MIVPGADDMQLYQPTHKLAEIFSRVESGFSRKNPEAPGAGQTRSYATVSPAKSQTVDPRRCRQSPPGGRVSAIGERRL